MVGIFIEFGLTNILILPLSTGVIRLVLFVILVFKRCCVIDGDGDITINILNNNRLDKVENSGFND
ncbi:hypothetical protein DERP_004925 [Dermatophagoides pteronyssinus]|uniref:Uncharacterized protein n=1 Tax=Dermatophagoides pteronyssinus TaxID=6956 RepID=A0ABQ8JSY0_DERPT|nr:hypothetical protein DERP_004925 [Dermatophagoides pteronyssinus]